MSNTTTCSHPVGNVVDPADHSQGTQCQECGEVLPLNGAPLNLHRESVVDPSEYRHVGEFYQGPSEEMHEAYLGEHIALTDQGVDFDRGNVEFHANGGCAHCGSQFSYGSVFHHEVHGFVAIGHVCAENRFSEEIDSNAMLRIKLIRDREAAKRKTLKERVENGLKFADQLDAMPELAEAINTDHHIIEDIRAKGFQYGSISDRQAWLIEKIAKEEAEKVPAEEAPEPGTVPVTDERVTFTGKIVSIKEKVDHYAYGGYVLKMLVECNDGEGPYRVYGSLPKACRNADRGDIVQFGAKVQRSDDDESFGFFSRPTKAKVIED